MTSSQKKIKQLMQKYDTLGALFIETAILNYGVQVLNDGLDEWGDNSLISRDLWIAIATDAVDELANKRNVVSE
jgi:hypothetical protein